MSSYQRLGALMVLVAGLVLGIGLALSGPFSNAGIPVLASASVPLTAPQPLLVCGQTSGHLPDGGRPCLSLRPRIPPPPGGLGTCDAETDCLSLRELLGAWTTALAILVGLLGTLWVVQGCVVALRPGYRESVWAAMVSRVLTVCLAYYIAWRVDDFAQFVLAVLLAHKSDTIHPLNTLGQYIGGGPPLALLVDFIVQLVAFLSQCLLVFFAPSALLQGAAAIGSLLWVPDRYVGRESRRAVFDILRLIAIGFWLLFAPSIVGGFINLLSGALSS